MKEFTAGKIKLLNCDCMEYMAGLGDNAFDLAVVDPPYGIGESGGTNKDRGGLAVAKNYKPFHGNDLKKPSAGYIQKLRQISRNQIVWGANHFVSNVAIDSSAWVVWDKKNTGDFADCELAWTSFSTAVRIFRHRWNGMLQENMKNKENRIHPTQKPVALYKWLMANYAEKGQRILDTHLGSGSSAIAAHYFGCEFVGCELDEDYFDAACERFTKETRQISMF